MDETLDPKRRLEIEGAYNVRDLGGYCTGNGCRTRWQRFLRADSLHQLSPSAQTALLDYGVRTVIDLRRTSKPPRPKGGALTTPIPKQIQLEGPFLLLTMIPNILLNHFRSHLVAYGAGKITIFPEFSTP